MKLVKVRVQNFKSIVDSGVVKIEESVTVLVGKNEQGKTTFLKGLASWNPKVIYAPTDLPNHLRSALEKKKSSLIPVVTLWVTAETSEIQKIGLANGSEFQEFRSVRFHDGHREHYGVKADGSEARLKFSVPNFSQQVEKIKNAAITLKSKLQSHTGRHGEFAAHYPQAESQIDQFVKADFNKVDQMENLVKTFSTSLRSVPAQDAPIQEDIGAALKEIDAAQAEIRQIVAVDQTRQFEELLPNFIFHSTNLDKIPNDVLIAEFVANPDAAATKGMANLCAVAGLSVQKIKELAASPDVNMRQTFEDTYNSTISGGINEIWSQEKYNIHFRFEPERMSVSISDNTYTRRIAPSDRSDGFQWYLSFYAAIQSEGSLTRLTVFLLDNPGLELHADGQRDIKKYLEERPNEQVIYVTHSPAMVDPFNLEQVRQVDRDAQGTKVSHLAFKEGRDFDLLEPVRSAIGASLASSMVLNELNILVEGAADKAILEGAFEFLHPDYKRKLLVNGSVSETKDAFLVRFYQRANLPYLVLLDADDNGRRLMASLRERGVPEEKIKKLSDAIKDPPNRDFELEDIISPAFYHRAVQAAYPRSQLPIPEDSDKKRTTIYMEKIREELGVGFNKRRVAVQLKKFLMDGEADEATIKQLRQLTSAVLSSLEGQISPRKSPREQAETRTDASAAVKIESPRKTTNADST
jgi:predicted ATP-dependent endonuclease of OLD family